jgi:hypothetical protein
MYERNEILHSEEAQQPKQTPPAKNPPANSPRPATPPVIPVNLSAGMLENNRMKRPKRAIDIIVSVVGHGLVLAVAILIPMFFSKAIDVHQLQSIYLVSPPPPATARRAGTRSRDSSAKGVPVQPRTLCPASDSQNYRGRERS